MRFSVMFGAVFRQLYAIRLSGSLSFENVVRILSNCDKKIAQSMDTINGVGCVPMEWRT